MEGALGTKSDRPTEHRAIAVPDKNTAAGLTNHNRPKRTGMNTAAI